MADTIGQAARSLVGEKIVYAHALTVHGNLNMGPAFDEDLPIEIVSLKCDGGLLDVVVRNRNSVGCLIHSVDFLIEEITPHFEDVHFRLMPVSCQYHFLVDLEHGAYTVELCQQIEPKGLDRFQVVFALGRMAAPEHRLGPWGYSLIFPPELPEGKRRGTLLAASVKASLCFRYDKDRTVTVPNLTFLLHPIGYGYRAKKIAGFTLDEKMTLLSDEDVNVVESAVRLLTQIGDPVALPGLQALAKADLTYLHDYYTNEIFKKTPDRRYHDLPDPDERLASFRSALSGAIDYLRQVGTP